MAFNINDIKSNFQFQGARPTLFNVVINAPGNVPSLSGVEFLVSATSIPESNLGNIAVPYFGRIVNFAGDRAYGAWTVQIMNDEDFRIRNALETWSDKINARVRNTRESNDYKRTGIVSQYGKGGSIVRQYEFVGIYPSSIDPINLSWADQNQFERFNATFVYDYWRIIGGTTGNAGGE